MCLLRPKNAVPRGECVQEYGVLMHNMEESCTTGTCFMRDGRYETLDLINLHKAFKRIKEDSYVLGMAARSELWKMYQRATADQEALNNKIAESQARFTKARAEASRVRQAQAAARAQKATAQQAPKKATLRDITLGCNVSMYFKWDELEASDRAKGALGKGQWCTATILKMEPNKNRQMVYTCMFHNANRTKSKFNGHEIKIARDNYVRLQALQAAEGESSSEDGLSDVDPYPAATKEPKNRHKVIAPLVTIPGTQGEPERTTDSEQGSVEDEANANTTGDEVSVEGQSQDCSSAIKDNANMTVDVDSGAGKTNDASITQDDQTNTTKNGSEGNDSATKKVTLEKNANMIVDEDSGAGKTDDASITHDDQTNPTTNGSEGNDNATKKVTLEESVTDETKNATSSQRHSDNTSGEQERVACPTNDGSMTEDDQTNTTTYSNEGSDNATKNVTLEESGVYAMHDPSSSTTDTENTTAHQERGRGDTNDGSMTKDDNTNTTTKGSEGSENDGSMTLEKRVVGETNDGSIAGETNDASSTKEASGSVTNVSRPKSNVLPPTRRYTKEDAKLKQRLFPCPGCGESADGSHQCGDCFAHVHVICGRPYEASTEGYGQLVRCEQCRSDHEDDDTADMTQVWQDDDNEPEEVGKEPVTNPHNDATQERQELATYFAALQGATGEPSAPAQECNVGPGNINTKKRRLELRNKLRQLHNKKHKKGTAAYARTKKRKMEIVRLIDALDAESKLIQNKEKPYDVSKDNKSKKKKMKEKVAMTGDQASSNGKYDATLQEDCVQGLESARYSTCNMDDETETLHADYYWDEQLQAYVYTGVKRPRKKDMANKMKNNWLMGMKRNCGKAKRDKVIAKITVTRANMNMVSTHIPVQITYKLKTMPYPISLAYRCTANCMRREFALWKTFSTTLQLGQTLTRSTLDLYSLVPTFRHGTSPKKISNAKSYLTG